MFFHVCVRICKPDSVVDSYLSRSKIALGLKRHFHPKMDTALHVGKDFAVSPFASLRTLRPQTYTKIIPLLEPSAFRPWRHCSHLLDCSRRALPATILPRFLSGRVRTFLSWLAPAVTIRYEQANSI